jgi:hypothetical protein
MSNIQSRIKPILLSHEQLDKQTVQTQYKAGYGHFIVKSRFNGSKPLSEMLYDIMNKQKNNYFYGRHDF